MAIRFSSTGLILSDAAAAYSLLAFVDAVLRGVGQVMLMNNA